MGDVKRNIISKIPILAGLVIGISLGGLVLFGLGINGASFDLFTFFDGKTSTTSPDLGTIAPDFELISITGESVHLSELQGSTVLINFWATWCAPCILEMPILQKSYERYSPELIVLAVNAGEPENEVRAFAEDLGLTFDIMLDPERDVEKIYRLRGYPTTFFLDAEGALQFQHIGTLTEGQVKDYLVQVGIKD